MKKCTVLLVIVLTFMLVGTIEAQTPRNLLPVGTPLTPMQTRCLSMGFGIDPFGYCMYERQIAWIAYGGGWSSIFRWSNTKTDGTPTGGVTVHIDVIGATSSDNPTAYVRDNRSGSVLPTSGVAYPLMPGESVEAEFLYPASHDASNSYSPDQNRTEVGSLWVTYTAFEPEHLQGLVGSSLSFLAKDTSGQFHWNAVEEETLASAKWYSQFSETFSRNDWKSGKATSMAIANPTGWPEIVTMTLKDERGGVITSIDVFLQVRETKGFLLREKFGDKMFPGGRDFTGTIEVTIAEHSPLNPGPDPQVVVTIFQVVGDSMGNLKAYRCSTK